MITDLETAILDILHRGSPTWGPLDVMQLTQAEEEATILLTAAEMIERRINLRLKLAGAPGSIDAQIVVTGEYGLAQALDPALAEGWALWSEIFNKRKADPSGPPVKFVIVRTKIEQMRLTRYGILAVKDIGSGQQDRVLDFVLRRGFYGPNSVMTTIKPDMYIPGYGRAPCRGEGKLEDIKVNQSDEPSVRVTNLGEISKPLSELVEIARARAGLGDNSQPKEKEATPHVGESMEEIRRRAKKIAKSDARILILGKTGTGKEHLARFIHAASPRGKKNFEAINCATLPKERVDSELYGHKKGAFTGAVADAPGRIRQAEGGTVLLDELSEIPSDCWGNLSRFLQYKEIQPVGDKTSIADVRIMAATSNAQKIPDYILYRFQSTFILPTLKERCDEIPKLARDFFLAAKKTNRRKALRFPKHEREKLATADFDWPGNVRQLENAIAGAVIAHGSSRDLTAEEVLAAALKPIPLS